MSYKRSRHRLAKEARAAALASMSDAEWGALAPHRDVLTRLPIDIQGTVVYPWDPDYDKDRQESNPAYQWEPLVIVYCEVPGDVRECLAASRQANIPVAVRSGGHSTAGYSVNDGLVVDTSRLNRVTVDLPTMTARVGAGTNFGVLNAVLDEHRVHVPSGACEDVCVAGFMQGGGYGYTSRMYGMNCDSVVGLTVMLATGDIVVANATQNSDLLWAMCGGTGGNFGVLLDVTYRVYNLWQVWGWTIQWPIAVGAEVMAAFQQGFAKTGDPRVGYMGNIGYDPGGDQVVVVQGMFAGDRDDGLAALEPLIASNGAELLVDHVASYREMDAYLDTHPYVIPNVPESGTKEIKQAGYINRPLSLAEWSTAIDYYRNGPPQTFDTAIFEGYGGAINRLGTYANAFIHRDCDLNFFVDAFWVQDADEAPAVAWLDGYMQVMAPLTNGQCYQNYPRRGLPDYQWMFWGNALAWLLAVREKYDPGHFFQYPQCVQPYDGDVPPPPGGPGPDIAAPIVYGLS